MAHVIINLGGEFYENEVTLILTEVSAFNYSAQAETAGAVILNTTHRVSSHTTRSLLNNREFGALYNALCVKLNDAMLHNIPCGIRLKDRSDFIKLIESIPGGTERLKQAYV